MKEYNVITFDTETCGLDVKKNHAITIGVVCATMNDRGELSESHKREFWIDWTTLIEGYKIDKRAQEINGITVADIMKRGSAPLVAYAEMFNFICKAFGYKRGITPYVDLINCFNMPFDMNMLINDIKFTLRHCQDATKEYREIARKLMYVLLGKEIILDESGNLLKLSKLEDREDILFIDSMFLDRIFEEEAHLFPKRSHNLQTVGEMYGIPEDPNAHNALADADRTIKVLSRQIKDLEKVGWNLDKTLESKLESRQLKLAEWWNDRNGQPIQDYRGRNDYKGF